MDSQKPCRLRVLHLFSSWKWTGPAEPVALLVEQLRRSGLEVDFCLPPPPRPDYESLQDMLSKRGMSHSLLPALDRKRLHAAPAAVRSLARLIVQRRPEIIHTHHSHEHWIAGIACRIGRHRPRLIRSDFHRDGVPPREARAPLRAVTDAVVTFSGMSRRQWIERAGFSPGQVIVVPPCFDASRVEAGPPLPRRTVLGFEDRDFVVGLACRLQKDRHIDLFLAGIAEAAPRLPNLRVLILGRSSQALETVTRPVQALGLEDRVAWAGYRHDDYYSCLAAIDLLVYSRAGSDGTGRGMLEAMALGVPLLVHRTGMLTEFLPEGGLGNTFEGTASDLARQIIRLAGDEQQRKDLARRARLHSARFRPEEQAREVKSLYRTLVAGEKIENFPVSGS